MILRGRRWSTGGAAQAIMDIITTPFMIFYLIFLLYGGYPVLNTPSPTGKELHPWAPPLAPIKIIMTWVFC